MFDPVRDDDRGPTRFYMRLTVIVALGIVLAGSLWPSVTAFTAGPDQDQMCVAIADAWRGTDAAAGTDADAAACRPESRRRVLFTAAGLGAVGIGVTGTVLVRGRRHRVPRTRTNLRHSPAAGAGQ